MILDRLTLQDGQIVFVLGTRFGGVLTREPQEVALDDISQFVTHQELQRYENARFKAELEAEIARKRLGRPPKSLLVGNPKASLSRSPEPNPVPLKKPRGRPRKTMLSHTSSDTGSVRPKGPRGRPKSMVTFAKEPSIDELDQPTAFAEEQRRPIDTITVQIPVKTKRRVDAIRSKMLSAIAPPANSRLPPSRSYGYEQGAIGTAKHGAFRADPDFTQRSPTLPLMSQPLVFDSKSPHRALASNLSSFQGKHISPSTDVADGSSRPSIISSASSSHKSYQSCYSPCEPDLQSSRKQSDRNLPRQDIRMMENKSGEHHTLSHPVEGGSAKYSGGPLSKNLESQFSDSGDELSEDAVSYLQQFQASIPLPRRSSPPNAPTPSLSYRPAPWFRNNHQIQMLENPPHQDSDQKDVRMEDEADAISLLKQFRAPLPLPSSHNEVATPAPLPSHSHRPTPSPRKTSTLQTSPKSQGSVSMTPHYPSRNPFAKTPWRKDSWDKGSERKRKRMEKVMRREGGREESIEL